VAHCLASAEAAAAAAAGGAGGPGARGVEAAGSGPLSYIATDALALLVTALVVQMGGGEALLSRCVGAGLRG
jgi:CCR4-NOT transcription complex subunit 1